MKTYRFYTGKIPFTFYVLLEKSSCLEFFGGEWLCLESTFNASDIGRYFKDVMKIFDWNRNNEGNFGMEFEADSLEEVREKIFTYIL